MQYQVPQFIETEDKLVGPFSLRQFIYVGAAGAVCGVAYFFVQTWLFVIITILALGGAFALAFLKVNGRPLIKVATSAINFYWKPQTYVWKPDHPVMKLHKQTAPAAVRELPPVEEEEERGRRMARSPFTATETQKAEPRELPPVQTIARGDSLHKSWENLQTGTPNMPEGRKTSDRQFLEKKMAERYQIFQRQAGDRAAARRVDYR